jgi:hypothetical protein
MGGFKNFLPTSGYQASIRICYAHNAWECLDSSGSGHVGTF